MNRKRIDLGCVRLKTCLFRIRGRHNNSPPSGVGLCSLPETSFLLLPLSLTFFCPSLHTRAAACLSTAGFQSGSNSTCGEQSGERGG